VTGNIKDNIGINISEEINRVHSIRALSSPFATKPGRWPGHLGWGHGSHRKQGVDINDWDIACGNFTHYVL
jgi:hypothetical protein